MGADQIEALIREHAPSWIRWRNDFGLKEPPSAVDLLVR